MADPGERCQTANAIRAEAAGVALNPPTPVLLCPGGATAAAVCLPHLKDSISSSHVEK